MKAFIVWATVSYTSAGALAVLCRSDSGPLAK